MRTNSRKLAVAAGICALLASASLAQPQDAGPASKGSAPHATTSPNGAVFRAPNRELVTFDFPGGKVSDLVAMLGAEMAPLPLNVFIEPEAAKQPVPPVKLKGVSYYHVLRMLDRTVKDEQGRMVQTQLEQSNTGEESAPLFKIRAIEVGGGHSTGFSVLSLNPIVGLQKSARAGSSLDSDSVLAAIGAAVAASEDPGSSPPATLKFHEPSGLLFIRGTEAQREAAQEVVQQLRRDVDAERAAELAATAGRDTKKMLIKSQPAEDVAETVRRQLIGKCCVQLEVDGKYIVITGDKALVAEAAQRAYAIDGMPRPSTPAPNSDAK